MDDVIRLYRSRIAHSSISRTRESSFQVHPVFSSSRAPVLPNRQAPVRNPVVFPGPALLRQQRKRHGESVPVSRLQKKNIRSNPAEVSAGCYQDIQSLITSIKHVSVTSFDPCRLSSGSFVSKSPSWIPQGRPCHAEMYLSRTKIPHHISRRICISVEDMFRKQGVFFQTDGSLCRPRSCAWLQALICRRKSEISSQITNHSYSIADVHPTYRATSANLSICHHEKGQTAVKAALLWYLSISQTRREGKKGGEFHTVLCN